MHAIVLLMLVLTYAHSVDFAILGIPLLALMAPIDFSEWLQREIVLDLLTLFESDDLGTMSLTADRTPSAEP